VSALSDAIIAIAEPSESVDGAVKSLKKRCRLRSTAGRKTIAQRLF
jgi:hypothetical protein